MGLWGKPSPVISPRFYRTPHSMSASPLVSNHPSPASYINLSNSLKCKNLMPSSARTAQFGTIGFELFLWNVPAIVTMERELRGPLYHTKLRHHYSLTWLRLQFTITAITTQPKSRYDLCHISRYLHFDPRHYPVAPPFKLPQRTKVRVLYSPCCHSFDSNCFFYSYQ